MIDLTKRFLRFIGVDHAIFYVLLGRGWTVFAGLLTIWFIAHSLTEDERGVYYTFGNIISLQVFFELGLTYVVMQTASHEVAKLAWSNGILTGDLISKSRLSSLLRLCLKVYGIISVLFVVIVLPGGFSFFYLTVKDSVDWMGAWLWLCIFNGLYIFISPFASLLEGSGKVTDIAGQRFWNGVLCNIACWIVFYFGGGLYALVVRSIVSILVICGWFLLKYRAFFSDLYSSFDSSHTISWLKELFPFQWKIGISWLSGYFIFQLFNPIVLAYEGAADAGKMGMSLALASNVGAIGMAWINTKAPKFGNFVARKDWKGLDSFFFKALLQCMGVVLMAIVACIIGLILLGNLYPSIVSRFLSVTEVSLLLANIFFQCILFSLAAYLRAHKEEPLLGMSIGYAILVVLMLLTFIPVWGTLGVCFGITIIQIIVLIWSINIFKNKRFEWHQENHIA